MTIKQLTLIFGCGEEFDCAQCDGVVLIPKNPAILIAPAKYVVATIVSSPPWEDELNRYVVEYDDVLFVDPTISVRQIDFRVCCYDCGARLAELAQVPLQVIDTNSVDLTSSGSFGHTVKADVRIDNTTPNTLTVGPNGLLVPPTTLPTPLALAIAPGCGNIGANSALKVATLLGNVLTLQGAPEHTAVQTANISLEGGGNVFITPLTASLTNPSLCRSMVVFVAVEFGVTYIQQSTSGNPGLHMEAGAPGAGFIPIANLPSVNGAIWQGNYAAPSFETLVLPPGATFNFYRKWQIGSTGGGFPGCNVQSWGAGVRIIGVTI